MHTCTGVHIHLSIFLIFIVFQGKGQSRTILRKNYREADLAQEEAVQVST